MKVQKHKGEQYTKMKTENKMAELLAEFRAQNSEEEISAAASETAEKKKEAASAENRETVVAGRIVKSNAYANEDDEEINAEWLELISGMYV